MGGKTGDEGKDKILIRLRRGRKRKLEIMEKIKSSVMKWEAKENRMKMNVGTGNHHKVK